uniref:sensor histidine kinase n=1 Tax=Acetatifactor sp. TaxID=1872090 RepID=UPI00405774CA
MWKKIKNRVVEFVDRLKLSEKFTLIILVLVFVPVAGFTIFFFGNMEKNAINEEYTLLEYSLKSSYDDIIKNVDNINMSTQFFLSDKSLIEYLEKINNNEEISYTEMMNFYNVNISSLERMVNSNPNIYQIRVYVDNENMEEMMPILYRYDRMERLAWGKQADVSGWKYNYVDAIFEAYVMNQEQRLMALVTPITNYSDENLGILEVAVEMDLMFPKLYESNKSEIYFFVDNWGKIYCSGENREYILEYLEWNSPEEEAELAGNELVINEMKWKYDSLLVGSQYIKELEGTLVCIYNLQEEIGQLHTNRNNFLLIVIVISVVLVYLINYLVKRLLAQFYEVLQSVREVQSGDLNVVITGKGNSETAELGHQINKMMERIRQLMEDNLNRELLVKDSEIRALQNQINAHFIYNVLESIKMMAEIDEKYDISDAITSLGKLLRYSMRWTSGKVTVGEELEYVKNYLALMNLRFDYEIYLSLNIPEIVMHQEIPKMSLQPIVENAIVHGIEQIAENTNIYVKGTIIDSECIIDVTDCGRGMTEQEVAELHRKINGEIEMESNKGNGIGLKNVQDRIRINYGEKYGIIISSRLGCYTKVRMRVPQTYFDII